MQLLSTDAEEHLVLSLAVVERVCLESWSWNATKFLESIFRAIFSFYYNVDGEQVNKWAIQLENERESVWAS